jgi:prepilin-type N-terminal cleavage/methylation domain-containing protein
MKNAKNGFTLIELIIVLAILIIISSIALPSFTVSEQWILKATAQEMVNDIRSVQMTAVHTGKNYNFEIHLDEKFYRIRMDNPLASTIKYVELDDCIHSITSTLSREGYGGSYTNYRIITYTPTGIPSQTGSITIKTKSGYETEITIAVATGRVMIVK